MAGEKLIQKALQAVKASPKPKEDLVKLYHGTTAEGSSGINLENRIAGPAYFSPRHSVAKDYSLNNSDEPYVIEAMVPKSSLHIDLDLPGGRLLPVKDANEYTGNHGWTIDDYLSAGHSVGVPSDVPLSKSHGGEVDAALHMLRQHKADGGKSVYLFEDPMGYLAKKGEQIAALPSNITDMASAVWEHPVTQEIRRDPAYFAYELGKEGAQYAHERPFSAVRKAVDFATDWSADPRVVLAKQLFSSTPANAGEDEFARQVKYGIRPAPEAEPPQYAKGGTVYPLDDKSNWDENADYQETGGRMTRMSPSAFLSKVEPLKMDKEDKKSIKKFKKQIKSGKKSDPAAIYPKGGQDGRHHAAAAKQLAIKKMPVITWDKKASAGRIGYADRGRVIPEMEDVSQWLEMSGPRPVGPSLGDAYNMPAPDALVARPGTGAGTAPTPMPPDRMDRAKSLGFTNEVYHATRSPQTFDNFRMSRGPQRHDLLGVHVGSLQAADDRLKKYFGKDYGMKNGTANDSQSPSIMPLMARMENPYVKANGDPFTEAELRRKVTIFAQKNNLRPDSINAKIGFERYLRDQGHDHIPYINSVEDRGNVSYLILQPQNLRSRWAEFDPQYANEAGLGKNSGGSVVNRALMLLSKKAKSRPGRR